MWSRSGSCKLPSTWSSGEDLVRPRLPDTSARKQLAALLLLRLKLPGDRGTAAKEAVSLLVETRDSQQLQEAFGVMEESDIVTLLSSLDEAAVNQLRVAMLPCDLASRELVDKELARRLASRLNEERLKRLWQLVQGNVDAEPDFWARAAACLLSVHMGRIEVQLQNLSLKVLREACKFLDDKNLAISFAKDFLSYDLGISTAGQWPLRSSAPIFCELAGRLSEDTLEENEEKLQLLVKAHGIDESHPGIREALRKLLHAHMLSREARGESTMEGLFLKLALEEGDVPVEVLPKLTLSECHLKQASPEQLMKLSRQLAQHNQPMDGFHVAVLAANVFKVKGHAKQSEEAFLKAFALDPCSEEVAGEVANTLTSLLRCCEALKEKNNALEAKCKDLQKLGDRCNELEEKSRLNESKRKALELRCAELESLKLNSSIVWDLSSSDFADFRKGQGHWSGTFQLLCSGITAMLELYPKGREDSGMGKAGLVLHVERPATVNWTWQSGSGEVKTQEHRFQREWDYFVCRDFGPTRPTIRSITFRILSVQLPGSTLRFR